MSPFNNLRDGMLNLCFIHLRSGHISCKSQVYLKYLLPCLTAGVLNRYFIIKAAGPDKCLIKMFRDIRRSYDHGLSFLLPQPFKYLRKDPVGFFRCPVTAASSPLPEAVNLINED